MSDFVTKEEFEEFLSEYRLFVKEATETMKEVLDGNLKLEKAVAEAIENFFKTMGIPQPKRGKLVV